MPRSVNGTYTLPESAFVSGTVISSSAVNSDLSDIATALTESLATTGVSSMTGPIKASDGTSTAPGYTFASDTATGFYLSGTTVGLAISSTVVATFTTSLFTVGVPASFSSSITVVGPSSLQTVSISSSASVTGPLKILAYSVESEQSSNPATASANTLIQYVADDGFSGRQWPKAIDERGIVFPTVGVYGQCRLTLSGVSLYLAPYNGNLLTINGVPQIIPDTGVSLSAGGLTASTFFYIYAYMDSGTMTLERSTTAYESQAGTGIPQKIGDATRTLVGAAHSTSGSAWADTDGSLWVLSWFNRRRKSSKTRFTASRSTTSVPFDEVNTEIRCDFLTWADEYVETQMSVTSTHTGANVTCRFGIGYDSTSTATQSTISPSEDSPGSNIQNAFSANTQLSEGASHYVTLLAGTASGTLSFSGNSFGASVGTTYLLHYING